jgi:Peptidase C39 family
MALDLVSGIALIAALAVALFLATATFSRRLSSSALSGLSVIVVGALLLYIRSLWYDVRLATWLPFSNLVVVGNWLPLLAAMLAGVAWEKTRNCSWRRFGSVGALGCTALYALVYPVLGTAPRCDNRWDWMGNCLQTTDYTCSAASAATLLKAHGIQSSEQEMAELCLTRHGTSWQGLYRGLKLKTAGTMWEVQIVSCSRQDLAQLDGPMIISVGLESSASYDTEFTREFGWIPGVNHSVILHGFTRFGCAIIADPTQALSREQWDDDTLKVLWRGYAVRLVERQ